MTNKNKINNFKIVKCPKCNSNLKVPYLKGKKLKVHCPKCGYDFETIFPLNPYSFEYFFNNSISEAKKFITKLNKNNFKYILNKYKGLAIVIALLLLNILLKIILIILK